jgi:hypothetical protein
MDTAPDPDAARRAGGLSALPSDGARFRYGARFLPGSPPRASQGPVQGLLGATGRWVPLGAAGCHQLCHCATTGADGRLGRRLAQGLLPGAAGDLRGTGWGRGKGCAQTLDPEGAETRRSIP